jgi:hypothetical protein
MMYSNSLRAYGLQVEGLIAPLAAFKFCPVAAALLATGNQLQATLQRRKNKNKALTAWVASFADSAQIYIEQRAAEAAADAIPNDYGISKTAARELLADNVCAVAFVLGNDSKTTGLKAGSITVRIATRDAAFYAEPSGKRVPPRTVLPFHQIDEEPAEFKGVWRSAKVANIVGIVPLAQTTQEAQNLLQNPEARGAYIGALKTVVAQYEGLINAAIKPIGNIYTHQKAITTALLSALQAVELTLPLFANIQQTA